MFFYEVKKEADGCFRSDGDILIAGEVYTLAEVQKYQIPKECIKRISARPENIVEARGMKRVG